MAETRTTKQIAADKVAELIEKLEKAERGSRELDVHIRRALIVNDENAYVKQSEYNGEWCIYSGEWQGRPRLYENRDRSISTSLWRGEYTASLDAAVALMGRVLPGWHYSVGGCPADFLTPGIDKPFSAELMGPVTWRVIEREIGQEPTYDSAHGSAQTAPIALCLAILKAVRAHMHPRDREETRP